MSDPAVGTKYYILNSVSGTVIDLSSGNPSPNTAVQGYQMNSGNTNQQWILSKASQTDTAENYQYYFVTNAASGTILDVNGSSTSENPLVGNPKNGSGTANQKWRFISIDGRFPPVYEMAPYGAYNQDDGTDKFRVDLKDYNSANGTVVQIFSQNGSSAQRWFFIQVPK